MVDVHGRAQELMTKELDFDHFSKVLEANRVTEEMEFIARRDTAEIERTVMDSQGGKAPRPKFYAETGSCRPPF